MARGTVSFCALCRTKEKAARTSAASLRGDAPQVASYEDCDNNLDRSVRQLLSFPGHSCVGLLEVCPGFLVIRVAAHNALTRERLEIALDLLVSEPFLEGRHTQEVGCDKLMTDEVEEIVPPRVVDIASAQSVERRVYTLLQEGITDTERPLPCLPLPVHTP